MIFNLKTLEVILYSITNLLPYLLFAIYPFWDKLRYSKKFTITVIFLLLIIQCGFGIWAGILDTNNSRIISIISTVTYISFYFFVIKVYFGKSLFTLFMLSNTSNFSVISSKFFEKVLFPNFSMQLYRWTSSVLLIIVDLIIFIPLIIFFKKIYVPTIKSDKSNYIWRYLWLVPATFYLLWYNTIYYNYVPSLHAALDYRNVIFLFFINVGSFLVYYVVIRMVNESEKNFELQTKNHQLEMQATQYESFKNCIDAVRRVKHDFRHHMIVIHGYLDNHEYDNLNKYLDEYFANTSLDNSIVFCENYSVNMLISYFNQLARANNIDFSVNINLPSDIGILDSDISIIFGNLIENSIEACTKSKNDQKKIIINSNYENHTFIFTIDNTYDNSLSKNKSGVLYSSKHSGLGIGVESVKYIVKSYNGIIKFEQANGMFCVSILINLK